MPKSPVRLPSRSALVSIVHLGYDRLLRVFADPTVPVPVRMDCWRDANEMMDELFDGAPPTDGRSRRR